MSTFIYQGRDKNGKKVTGTITAPDRFAVYKEARAVGHTVESIDSGEGFQISKIFNLKKLEILISRVKNDELVMMTRNLGSMLTAGLPLSRALSVISRQSKNPRLKMIILDLIARINKGESFHVSLRAYPKVFSKLYTAMIEAGEESGQMAQTLQTLSVQMERTSSLKKKIKGPWFIQRLWSPFWSSLGS